MNGRFTLRELTGLINGRFALRADFPACMEDSLKEPTLLMYGGLYLSTESPDEWKTLSES